MIADVRAKIKKAEPVLDVEFPQLLQDMIGDLTSAPEPVRDQAVLAGPGAAAASGRRKSATPSRRSPAWWTC